jgi:hypothetical protein
MKMRGWAAFVAAALLALGASACDGGGTEPKARPDDPSMDCGPGLTGGGGKQNDSTNVGCTRTAP